MALLPTWSGLLRITEPAILIGAISIAFIASAETLLCATAVDQMHSGVRTKYDRELSAQGVGNMICGLLGVLPMTGVIVRSGANVEAGAVTRASAILHGVWLLLFVSALPFTLRYIPTSALAAVLVFTATTRLSEDRAHAFEVRYGRSDHLCRDHRHDRADRSLEVVVLGLALSLAKLLYAFTHLDIRKEETPAEGRVDLYLKAQRHSFACPLLPLNSKA